MRYGSWQLQFSSVEHTKPFRGDVEWAIVVAAQVAITADGQGKPKLDSILKHDVHLRLTASDNIISLHERCGAVPCQQDWHYG